MPARKEMRISLVFLMTMALLSTACGFSLGFADHDLPGRCLEVPALEGPCEARIPRYTFIQEPKPYCELFTYGGCRGNGNNFKTLNECQELCIATPHP